MDSKDSPNISPFRRAFLGIVRNRFGKDLTLMQKDFLAEMPISLLKILKVGGNNQ
ncbi:hypothetical protein KKC08_00545 [Patescibacteria group bacterium]|nr:hypothetical protein [Patescibacteria group bacterium]MBU4390567.1 hypothetical protein [Patescibacteria group bacterium]MBU4396643.1 hypothetical protein [Patescibacteria group bacterium]MBU4578337.1 hypothetical protein [Patescibacteria group bacterium]MCG2702590.1 hypothetical protein [Candidatus Parcubacteria bacterium]